MRAIIASRSLMLKFAPPGVVIAQAFEPSVGLTVARIRFDHGQAGERSIALGGGALRAVVA